MQDAQDSQLLRRAKTFRRELTALVTPSSSTPRRTRNDPQECEEVGQQYSATASTKRARNAPDHPSPQKPDGRSPRQKASTKSWAQPPHPTPRTGIQAGKPRRSPPHKLNQLAPRRSSALPAGPNPTTRLASRNPGTKPQNRQQAMR